tara:strand:+ start:550 stop:732 length:183 start_codon:yes stop_codon:yes gene_type:complete
MMLNEHDLKEFYELLEKKQEEYSSAKKPELKSLIDEQVDLLQALISVQTKIIAKLTGFNV